MYVPNVECTSVVHVVMLSLKSAGEGADSKFVPRRGVRSRALAHMSAYDDNPYVVDFVLPARERVSRLGWISVGEASWRVGNR